MTDRPDPIDEQLKGYAARWRDALPPPPAVPTDLPTHSAGFGRRGRGVVGWLPLVAAAVVLAVVVVAVRLGQGGTDLGSVGGPTASVTTTATSSATATGSAVNNGVVPWVPLPATNPLIPVTTVPASPDPALAQGLPVCRAADLTATSDIEGATGTMYLFVQIVSRTGTAACRLEGFPNVVSLVNGAAVSIPSVHGTVVSDAPGGIYPHPVLVAPDVPAALTLFWSNWCGQAVRQTHVRLTWPSSAGGVTVPGFGQSPGCQMEPGTVVKTPFGVSTFKPAEVRDELVTTAYAGVTATMDAPSVVAVGEPIRLTVTLTAPRDIPLEPCPDILVGDYTQPPDGTNDRYALNCAAVPYRDSAGRPYLPATVPVRFAAEVPAANVGEGTKLLWRLALPDGADPVDAGSATEVR